MITKTCVVFWHGFPACAHMLLDLSKKLGNNLTVISTKPTVPFAELGKFLTKEIIYLQTIDEIYLYWKLIKKADIFIHTGWCFSEVNKIDLKLKSFNSSARIYVLVDNRLKYSLRQLIGYFVFRIFYDYKYDGYIVSGKKAYDLLIFFGVEEKKISSGHYGASEDIYPRKVNLIENKKNRFIFVGSLDKRKGFDILIKAWKKYIQSGGTWELLVIGKIPEYFKNIKMKNLTFCGFKQPKDVAHLMQESSALILPGRDDNWATVIAEAAASGCILVSSKNVGATYDLIHHQVNGYVISKYFPINSLFNYLKKIETLSQEERKKMFKFSINLSKDFKSDRLTKAINNLLINA